MTTGLIAYMFVWNAKPTITLTIAAATRAHNSTHAHTHIYTSTMRCDAMTTHAIASDWTEEESRKPISSPKSHSQNRDEMITSHWCSTVCSAHSKQSSICVYRASVLFAAIFSCRRASVLASFIFSFNCPFNSVFPFGYRKSITLVWLSSLSCACLSDLKWTISLWKIR